MEGEKSEQFLILRNAKLGEGRYGKVFKAFDTQKGIHVAVKEIDNLPAPNSSSNNAEKNSGGSDLLDLMMSLDHPNIVRIFKVAYKSVVVGSGSGSEGGGTTKGGTTTSSSSSSSLCCCQIFMEWLPSGSILSVMQSTGFRLNENVIRIYLREALRGLAYLHERGIVHRYLKPSNIILDHAGHAKLSDCGITKIYQKKSQSMTSSSSFGFADDIIGNNGVAYSAPEAIKGKVSHGSDLWALACCVIEMATGEMPWAHLPEEQKSNQLKLLFHIGSVQPPTLHHPPIPPHLSDELQGLLRIMFSFDPKERSSAKELLDSRYFSLESPAGEKQEEYLAARKERQMENQRTFSRDSVMARVGSSGSGTADSGETGEGGGTAQFTGGTDGVSRSFGQTGPLQTMDLDF